MSDWISVRDKLPNFHEKVLTFTNLEDYDSFKLDYLIDIGNEKIWACRKLREENNQGVTFWMPLPAPPKE